MLNELLPGVRDLRTPLAVGYIWLVFVWLIWGRHLPDSSAAVGLLRDIYTSAAALNPVAIGIAASFIAYLFGSLSTALSDSLLVKLEVLASLDSRINRYTRRLHNRKLSDRAKARLDKLVERNREDQIRGRLREALALRFEPYRETVAKRVFEDDSGYRIGVLRSKLRHPSRSHLFKGGADVFNADFIRAVEEFIIDDYLHFLKRDLNLVPARLLGNDPDLFNAYDRLQAESQFRLAISFPISAVAVALSVIDHPGWIVFLVMPAALCLTGLQRRRESTAVLAEAILAGRVESPVFARFEKLTEESVLDHPADGEVAEVSAPFSRFSGIFPHQDRDPK